MNDALPPVSTRRFSGRNVWWMLVLTALALVRFTREHELPPVVRESILLRLKADYSRPVLQAMDGGGGDRATLAANAALLAQRQQVQLDRVTARGILWPKYVRVEVSVHGSAPPDGDPVRYFVVDYLGTGTATSQVTGIKYYCNLF